MQAERRSSLGGFRGRDQQRVVRLLALHALGAAESLHRRDSAAGGLGRQSRSPGSPQYSQLPKGAGGEPAA
jgi:hypothetical protein